MKLVKRLHGSTGIKIIVGSALFWSWCAPPGASLLHVAHMEKRGIAKEGDIHGYQS